MREEETRVNLTRADLELEERTNQFGVYIIFLVIFLYTMLHGLLSILMLLFALRLEMPRSALEGPSARDIHLKNTNLV